MTDPEPSAGRRRWHLTAAETGGRLARAEHWAPAGSGAGPLHVHEGSLERMEVLAGAVDALVGKDRVRISPGESVRIPAGVEHSWVATADAHLFLEWVRS